MTRDELDQLMLVYAAGAADDAERALAETELASGSPAAQSAYAEALATVTQLPLALPVQLPSAGVRDRLLQSVTASAQSGRAATVNRPWLAWGATAVAAGLAVALTLALARNQRMSDQLATAREEMRAINSVMASPYVRLAKFDVKAAQGAPRGRLMYCPVTKQYQLMVYDLAPPPPGRVYELWLITPDQQTKVPAGTFTVDAKGVGTHYITMPAGEQYALAAITDEPTGGSLQPTGQIQLIGALTQ